MHSLRTTFLFAAVTTTVLVGFAGEAEAFCRTTTCDANSGSCTTDANGCITDGVSVVWTTSPIVYRFYSGGSSKLDDGDMRAAVKAAFATWSDVQCDGGRTSVRFEKGSDIADDKPPNAKQASEPFGIYFRDDTWLHHDSNEELALTNQIYGVPSVVQTVTQRGGEISYADIEVNTAQNTFVITDDPNADGTDFQAVMTHEAGHYLGLAHSKVDGSVMLARYCQPGTPLCGGDAAAKRTLSDDDIAAVCAVYPPPSATTDDAAPAASGCAETSHTKSPAEGFGLVFLAWAILRRLRSPRCN